jgi:hypothetical protein
MIYQTASESLVAVALFAIITAKIIVITIAYYSDLLMRYLESKLIHWKGYIYLGQDARLIFPKFGVAIRQT